MTVRDLIDAKITEALEGAALEVMPEPAGDPSVFPSLSTFMSGSTVVEREASLTRYQTELTVVGFVEGDGGEDANSDRNKLHADVVTRLMGDGTFGDLVEVIEDGDLRFATAELASTRRLMFAQDFTIQFTTSRGNPALPA